MKFSCSTLGSTGYYTITVCLSVFLSANLLGFCLKFIFLYFCILYIWQELHRSECWPHYWPLMLTCGTTVVSSLKVLFCMFKIQNKDFFLRILCFFSPEEQHHQPTLTKLFCPSLDGFDQRHCFIYIYFLCLNSIGVPPSIVSPLILPWIHRHGCFIEFLQENVRFCISAV